MSELAISLLMVLLVFGGAVLAMYAARALPDAHLSAEARDVIKLGMALIATLVALVLGLMIATAKGTFDAQSAGIRQLSANILLLDRTLAEYGSETGHARDLLHQAGELTLRRLWPEDGTTSVSLAPGEGRAQMQQFLREINDLSPRDGTQQFLKAQALRNLSDLAQTRFQMYVQGSSGLPTPFLLVVGFWLVVLFAGYGLIAARNSTVLISLLVCTLSVSGAVFLIQELANPFEGLMRVSSLPLRQVLAILGQ